MSYRIISLDTAADEPNQSDLAKIMRELPTMQAERGTVVLTKNGNLVEKVVR